MIDELTSIIAERLNKIQQRVAKAAQASGRTSDEVTLVVVSKTQPVDVIEAAIAAGVRCFGENYPEEALEKIERLQGQAEIQWHMIGHLQSRKAKIVADHFAMLHSLDSFSLAEKLDRLLAERGKSLACLLEFNVGEEESKFGWPAWDEGEWDELLPEISRILSLGHLKISGLMTMPPLMEDVENSRPYFRELRKLSEFLSTAFPGGNFRELSMGTSADFDIAIEEGATMVRIGQAILGARPPK